MDVTAQRYLSLRYILLYSEQCGKRAVAFFWAIFIAALIILLVASGFIPDTHLIKTNRSELMDTPNTECSNPVSFTQGVVACQNFSEANPKVGLLMKQVSVWNLLAIIELILIPKTNTPLHIFQDNITAELISLIPEKIADADQNTFQMREGGIVSSMDFHFQSNLNALTQVVDENGKEQMGFEIQLGFFKDFRREYYLLVITVSKDTATNFHIVARATLINPSYTLYVLIQSIIFMIVSILSTFMFLFRLRTATHLLPEQRCVRILSISLIVYNAPITFLELYFPSFLSLAISALAAAQFLIVLLATWGYFFEKILADAKQQPLLFSILKKTFISLLLATCLVLLLIFSVNITSYAQNQKPILQRGKFGVWVSFATLLSFAVVFIYLLSLYVRALQHFQNLIPRHRLILAFNTYFVVLLCVFIAARYLSLQGQERNVQICFTSMNLYVVYLQYMYSFASNAPQEETMEKDFSRAVKMESEREINLDENKMQY